MGSNSSKRSNNTNQSTITSVTSSPTEIITSSPSYISSSSSTMPILTLPPASALATLRSSSAPSISQSKNIKNKIPKPSALHINLTSNLSPSTNSTVLISPPLPSLHCRISTPPFLPSLKELTSNERRGSKSEIIIDDNKYWYKGNSRVRIGKGKKNINDRRTTISSSVSKVSTGSTILHSSLPSNTSHSIHHQRHVSLSCSSTIPTIAQAAAAITKSYTRTRSLSLNTTSPSNSVAVQKKSHERRQSRSKSTSRSVKKNRMKHEAATDQSIDGFAELDVFDQSDFFLPPAISPYSHNRSKSMTNLNTNYQIPCISSASSMGLYSSTSSSSNSSNNSSSENSPALGYRTRLNSISYPNASVISSNSILDMMSINNSNVSSTVPSPRQYSQALPHRSLSISSSSSSTTATGLSSTYQQIDSTRFPYHRYSLSRRSGSLSTLFNFHKLTTEEQDWLLSDIIYPGDLLLIYRTIISYNFLISSTSLININLNIFNNNSNNTNNINIDNTLINILYEFNNNPADFKQKIKIAVMMCRRDRKESPYKFIEWINEKKYKELEQEIEEKLKEKENNWEISQEGKRPLSKMEQIV